MKKEARSLLLVLMLFVFVLTLSISALLIGQGVTVFANTTDSYLQNFKNDCVIVTLTEDATRKFKTYYADDFKEVGCIGVENLTEFTDDFAKRKSQGGSTGESMLVDTENYKQILKLNLNETGADKVVRAIELLNKRDDVLVAGPNYIHSINAIPNDTYCGVDGTWGLNGTYGIQAESAWDISTGSNSITIGVLDTGIQANHPDLVNRISTAGLHRDCTVNPIKAVSNSELVDPNGHGTHVAGIIGAQGNNSTGVCGVCWDVSLVSLRVFDENGDGDTAYEARAINFAASQNIPILNYSGGGYVFDNSVLKALENYKGLFVCSAGNGGEDKIGDDNDEILYFPSEYSNGYACSDRVISVGSINDDGTRSYFSNYGNSYVSLFAPGEEILSTYPQSLCDSTLCKAGVGSHIAYGYHKKSGTSMAAPFVAGVAALLLSTDNTLTASELKQIICDSVVEDSNLKGKCVTGGRLNAYNAVNRNSYKLKLVETDTRTVEEDINNGDEISISIVPTRSDYEFEGYYTGKNGTGTKYIGTKLVYSNGYYYTRLDNLGKRWYGSKDLTLYANWTQMKTSYTYNVYQQGGGGEPFTTGTMDDIVSGDKIILPAPTIEGYTFNRWVINDVIYYAEEEVTLTLYRSPVTGQLTIYYKRGGAPSDNDGYMQAVYDKKDDGKCIAEGTLITLADGSQKAVELLTGNEQLLVWNLKTGSFDSAPILFIDSDALSYYDVINLYFSDGTSVKVISEHAFWDIDLNKYVTLSYDAEQYVGHWFNKQITNADGTMDRTKVQLTDVVINVEYTTAWSPVTYGHLCYYVNGMLSMPGGIEGLFNIFEVDAETMTYDKAAFEADIATYGLFTYEEFNELFNLPELMFEACGGQYLKVAIGKGLLDYSTLSGLVERYGAFFEN